LLEAQRVEKELCLQIESWSGCFERNNTIINKNFVHLDEELEVVELVGQKIDSKFGEFASDVMEMVEIKESHREDLVSVRADCLATLSDRCMHATTQATNVARIKAEGN
jgi:hypothetical protein